MPSVAAVKTNSTWEKSATGECSGSPCAAIESRPPPGLTAAALNLRHNILMSLAEKHCVPCRGGVPPLRGAELEKYQSQVGGWQVVKDHHLTKTFTFPDFL